MGTKLGMKRESPQTRIRAVSPKQAKRLRELHGLTDELRMKCGNRSEYSGANPNKLSGYLVEPHHLCGRIGSHLLNEWEIILVTREEHLYLQAHTKTMREELLALVRKIRLSQGFKE